MKNLLHPPTWFTLAVVVALVACGSQPEEAPLEEAPPVEVPAVQVDTAEVMVDSALIDDEWAPVDRAGRPIGEEEEAPAEADTVDVSVSECPACPDCPEALAVAFTEHDLTTCFENHQLGFLLCPVL